MYRFLTKHLSCPQQLISQLLLVVMTSFTSSVTLADNLFAENTPSNQKQSTPAPVLSASEFKNRVNTLSQQTQRDLWQQTTNSLKHAPLPDPTPAPPPPKTTTPPDKNAAADPTPPIQPQQPAAAPPPAPPADATNDASEPATSNQIYTGFQGTGNSNSNTNSTSPSGGGWNVKY